MEWITKNKGAIFLIAFAVVSILAIVFFSLWLKHECPELKTEIEIQKIHKEQIKIIENAETKTELDSLLIQLYGFESTN
jgi:hypothetical protein